MKIKNRNVSAGGKEKDFFDLLNLKDFDCFSTWIINLTKLEIFQALWGYLIPPSNIWLFRRQPFCSLSRSNERDCVEYYKIGVRDGDEIEDRHGRMDKLVSGDYQIYMGDELDDQMFDQVNYAFKRKEGGDARSVNLKLTNLNSLWARTNAQESFGKAAK